MFGSAKSQVPKLISRKIIFQEFQSMWSQSTNVKMDGQKTYHGNTALRHALHGKNAAGAPVQKLAKNESKSAQ